MPDPAPIVLPQNALIGPLVPQWKGVMKIIESNEVEKHTNDGWLVLGSFEEKTYEEAHGYAARGFRLPENHHNHYNDDGTVGVTTPMPATRWMFIVGRDEASVIAEKSERIVELEDQIKSAKERTDALTKDVEAERQRAASAESNSNYYRDEGQKARDQIAGRDERIRKMEDDLGKIRAAFGDLKIKEILADGRTGDSA